MITTHYFKLTLPAVMLLSICSCTISGPVSLPGTTPWNVEALSKAPKFDWIDREGTVHSLIYRGENYKGKPTRVFAYYASPATLGEKTSASKFPGIVLVHGGGGTAYETWAEIWARRGYAAIAMDLAGRGRGGVRLDDGGPDQSEATEFHAIDSPITDQWPYHGVSNVILAHSLLLSLDEVDQQRTALTGISWGGYLTCIVAGLDQRFKVAMPVYGCGFLTYNSGWVETEFSKMTPDQVDKWHTLWDPSQYIGNATMPIIFLNGTNDVYPMDSYAKTCALVRSEKNFSIQLRMAHSHIFDFPEFFLFIDQYILGATPMPVVSRPEIKNGKLTATAESATTIVSARLHYTTGPHRQNSTRDWVTLPLTVEGKRISGQAAPPNATAWYIDVTDERKALVSSEIMVPGLVNGGDGSQ